MLTLCNFEVWQYYFLTFIQNLQQLTHAKTGTTWAAAPDCITSCEQVYIHEHTQIHAPINRYV
jgi:hypothetical protein